MLWPSLRRAGTIDLALVLLHSRSSALASDTGHSLPK